MMPASEEHIATNILADRLSRLESAGLLERDAGEPRSGKQSYHATAKGNDLIPLLLQMMTWSAAHDPYAAVPRAADHRTHHRLPGHRAGHPRPRRNRTVPRHPPGRICGPQASAGDGTARSGPSRPGREVTLAG
jgi:hypothetical protein